MDYKGSIKAVNLEIKKFVIDNDLLNHMGLPERRLCEKFEEHDRSNAALRRTDAWQRWIDADDQLSISWPIGPSWAKARLFIHKVLSRFHIGDLTFTNGSSFDPLGPKTSVSCKLAGAWTCTREVFDDFAELSYQHRALKYASKTRFKRYCKVHNLDYRSLNKKLWLHYKDAFQCYKFKLHHIVTYVNGDRWSSVPKNNRKDRSICLQPFCNMLVQRAVGIGIRNALKRVLDIDVDNLADVHRRRLSDKSIATIDLSDASDRISLDLVKYLLPHRVFRYIQSSRSDMTLGPDGNYYLTRKVSCMGNGFTFDLMTLILTALSRLYDNNSSVFGDDIIISNQFANDLIIEMEKVGFVINKDKTLINSNYRESCGSHYIDGLGYVVTYNLRWLQTPNDLVTTYNKVALLSIVHGGIFRDLLHRIRECLPSSLLGAAVERPTVDTANPIDMPLDVYIRYGADVKCQPSRKLLQHIRKICRAYNIQGDISIAYGIESRQVVPARRSLSSKDWGLYYQYIHSSFCTPAVGKSIEKSTIVARVGTYQIGRV